MNATRKIEKQKKKPVVHIQVEAHNSYSASLMMKDEYKYFILNKKQIKEKKKRKI